MKSRLVPPTLAAAVTILAASPLAQAKSRCDQEAKTAVAAQAALDFPNQTVQTEIPDYDDTNDQRVETYVATVSANGKFLANYRMLVGETCQIMSPPVITFP